VIDLASRGRKRGLALVGATQRLSKLHKDVAAELLNKIIMRTGLDVDVQRAADELGMARARRRRPARARARRGVRVRPGPHPRRGAHAHRPGGTSHPKTGQRGMGAAAAVQGGAGQAGQAGRPAARGRAGGQDGRGLQREVADLRRKLTIAEKAQTGVPEAEVQRRVREAVAAPSWWRPTLG
jgi:DNA helicase HerA-like ATPase